MAHNTDHATINSFAQALLELADARNNTQQVADDVRGIAEVVQNDPAFAQFLADPTVAHAHSSAVLERVFSGQASEVVVAFLKLLSAKNRLGDFAAIAREFARLLDERAGNVDVEVTVAHALGHDDMENVRQQISHKLGKNAHIKQKVDESIIGGLILRVGDSLLDGSVRSQLETIKRRLVAAV